MPGTCMSLAVPGQDSSFMKANEMSAIRVAANKSAKKADSGCESDSDSNYACEAPGFDEDLSRARSRAPGKLKYGTGLSSGKTVAGSSDNPVDVYFNHDSVGRPCKKMKTESLNSVKPATGGLTSSKPCSSTTLPNSPHVLQVSKSNTADAGPLDVCCDVCSDDGEEAARLEDNEKVTPSCSQASVRPSEVAPVMPVRRTQNVWIIGDSWIFWLWKHAQKSQTENFNLPDKNIFWFPDKEARLWKNVLPTLRSTVGVPWPDILVLHCGADDLGYQSVFSLTTAMKFDILTIMSMFPKLKIVFSCIGQRQNWLHQFDPYISPDKARRAVNRYISEFLRENGMLSIHHNNITFSVNQLFLPDGVHLSRLGNSLFMNNICDTLKKLS